MSFQDLEALKAANDGKLTKRNHANQEVIEDIEDGPSSPKKRRLAPKATLDTLYQPAAGLDKIKATSKVLDGKVFVVEPRQLVWLWNLPVEKSSLMKILAT